MNKRTFIFNNPLNLGTVLFLFSLAHPQEKSYQLLSPDRKTEVNIRLQDKIYFSIAHNGQEMISPSPISLELAQHRVLGTLPTVKSVTTRFVKEEIKPVVPEKRNIVPDVYNEMELVFRGNYGLKIRAYNDGVAYRFMTNLQGNMIIKNEEVCLNLSPTDSIYFPEEDSFLSHSERLYKYLAVSDLTEKQMCCLPALVVKSNGIKLAIAEADLSDYPGLYLCGSGDGSTSLRGKFPPYPLEEQQERDRTVKVIKAADYIAQTVGRREFPWRVIAIAEKDGDLIENDIIYRLGAPLALKETAWIKPGKVAWDWWNANNIYGVDFKSGINTATYKYYIDFASRYGLEYIILDEGWSAPADLFEINPDMNMEELFTYARQKNVGIILWVVWCTLERQWNRAFDQFVKWGAKGIKVDFMQRDDQKMVNFYERVAKEAAQRQLLVDFHGAFKPTGMSRTYPNVLTREGVRGLEWCKWSKDITPEHDVTLPFIRMFAGPMDFTPGAMVNATKENFRDIFTQPMSQGTRCHQLAMYVVYESPLQMLSDSPSNYLKEPECMEFLAAVPTMWDETKVLNARVGEHVTVARKRGNDWYLGAMTDWTPRDFVLDLGFLDAGKYRMTSYADGINADKCASDYKKQTQEVTNKDTIKIHLAPGGGWAARLAGGK
ncbi:MAG: glycoside hydrolase family 97 protein [candidate division KSB1 bacterium]|nr:glycoside hydrolase family 97 protein [candidate division KSB1 bacterium]MDZ7302824.1 glycoside hydrolase family 97 protein [candidate division KSB1 bacterium]MDZ7311841.1 glycoside hydrolase family 97 protein [candidate division KSB1 bacterium]